MKQKKFNIQVRRGNEIIGTIKRQLRAEQIGNFNPLFCTFKGERKLVQSDQGNLSDPFRREDSYAESLFIKI
ncbi:MAG TPA: hypothetical protein VD905_21850 [Flavobacteriales bacterium]|nr:hypothetical protein [Flavobacteriales bacterium]